MRTTLFCLLIAAACAAPNRPPALASEPLALGQGEALTVQLAPIDPDGDHVTLTLVAHPQGLTASLADDGVTLSLRADYAVTGRQQVTVHLDDHQGGELDQQVIVDVNPLAWKWTENASGPTAREHGAFVYDEGRDVAYLIGGSGYMPQGTPAADAYWTMDLKTHAFTAFPAARTLPPGAASRRAANIPDRKVAYLFGGYDSNTTDVNDLLRFDYSADTPFFTPMPQVNPPPARELHAFAYDPGSDTFVTFGGYSNLLGLLNDTWTMKLADGVATWTKLDAPGPSPRYGFFYAMDPSTGRLYLWSGAQQPSQTDPIHAASDLWMLDLRASKPAWLRLLGGTEDGTPVGRRNGAFVFDPHGPRMFVFGGTADGATTVPGLSVLDLSGVSPTWVTMTLDNAPPLRSSDFGFYDTSRSQAVMGFGNDAMVFRDVFALGY
jgi:hypothetical protein